MNPLKLKCFIDIMLNLIEDNEWERTCELLGIEDKDEFRIINEMRQDKENKFSETASAYMEVCMKKHEEIDYENPHFKEMNLHEWIENNRPAVPFTYV
ncbi:MULTISPECIES: hypothetical protein [Carnobacterium]|uniref:Uncharacterized protein n=1 Tax=Carnobacterium divergens TaxID=2748 RepID=A0A2R7ZU83_CARDV|nr:MULTISPECIES: hypothetical protein [Carnobacterium]MCO6018765.1 hypothetical protein [Carnobacterium divergens]MDT1939642.1 hypothetical protein [Carnobacterium divergens]MDT1942080.1 hypothetical protein [Carnobacterium divergens]MDT1947878.1 hypothetical protein [Carnobacterium divergens]MDT1950366.1 hypothetical protein [Carnobacterium divergens]